jgi:hypothetical protein
MVITRVEQTNNCDTAVNPESPRSLSKGGNNKIELIYILYENCLYELKDRMKCQFHAVSSLSMGVQNFKSTSGWYVQKMWSKRFPIQ